MSKPIKLTEDLLQRIQEEFIEKVKSVKMFDGKLEYSRTFQWDDNGKATVFLSSVAFAKMNALIQQFSDEIAWHGVVRRDDNDPSIFYITDILVYPQVVTGATVNTDQEAYQTWLYSFDDETFNGIRMQGHSHVNMSVTPSGVDTTHQEKILEQIGDEDYYIFMIWNKRYEHFVSIFDMKNNTLYETKDVEVLVGDEGVNLQAFIDDAKKIVTKKTYTAGTAYQGGTYQGSTYQGGSYQRSQVAAASQAPKSTTPTTTPVVSAPANASPVGVKTKPKNKGCSTEIGRSFQDYGAFGDGYEQYHFGE